MKRFLAAAMVCAIAQTAAAQVGHTPAKSPFLDVDLTHELTPQFGYFTAPHDPAGVAPQGGLLAGFQYEWRATGPLHIGTDFIYVRSDRTTLDPAQPIATRNRGTTSQPLYGADGFAALSLTGGRSWHKLIPMVNLGFGFITDGDGPDVGGYKFGTRFAFPWGAGLRWYPGKGHLQVRADIKDWMYTIGYPQSYYIAVPPDAPILTPTTPQSRWTNNFAMTVGVSYFISH